MRIKGVDTVGYLSGKLARETVVRSPWLEQELFNKPSTEAETMAKACRSPQHMAVPVVGICETPRPLHSLGALCSPTPGKTQTSSRVNVRPSDKTLRYSYICMDILCPKILLGIFFPFSLANLKHKRLGSSDRLIPRKCL